MQTTSSGGQDFHIYYLSEGALTLEFGQQISPDVLSLVNHYNQLILLKPFPGLLTTVPAYTTLSVFFDPVQVAQGNMPGADCFEKVSTHIRGLATVGEKSSALSGETITIPVCYGGNYGPDLDELADLHQLSSQQVIGLHTAAVYQVYMIGFVPGFAYLGGLPPQLETPRKALPRGAVPAGAVGIAGMQTGIYPLITPGGWQIIGQTPLTMFKADRPQPALLKAGDRVVFEAISEGEFNQIAAA